MASLDRAVRSIEDEVTMEIPANDVLPLPDETRAGFDLGGRALWMLGVSVMVGVVVVAGLATAVIRVRRAA